MFWFKKKIQIKLVKAGCKDVIVNCPKSIKLGFMDLYSALRLDIPPLNVKPTNYGSVFFILIMYAAIFILPFFLVAIEAPDVFIIIFSIGIIVANILINRNYYWNIINKKLREGYKPANKETWSFLEEVKMPNNTVWDVSTSNTISGEDFDSTKNQEI